MRTDSMEAALFAFAGLVATHEASLPNRAKSQWIDVAVDAGVACIAVIFQDPDNVVAVSFPCGDSADIGRIKRLFEGALTRSTRMAA